MNKDSSDQITDLLTSSFATEASSGKLIEYSKEDLIQLVIKLKDENSTLKEETLFMERTNKRLEDLKRSHNLNFQYGHRDSVAITGMPTNIPGNGLEDELIKIFDHAKVEVNGTKLDKLQIQGCHRIVNYRIIISEILHDFVILHEAVRPSKYSPIKIALNGLLNFILIDA